MAVSQTEKPEQSARIVYLITVVNFRRITWLEKLRPVKIVEERINQTTNKIK